MRSDRSCGRPDTGRHEVVPSRRRRKHVVRPAVVEALVWAYHLVGDFCNNRLQRAIPELLRTAPLRMESAATGCLSREEKVKRSNQKYCSRTKPGASTRSFPVLSFR